MSAKPSSSRRIQSVEKILSMLQELPAGEPAADLAHRTLVRVDQALAALRGANVTPAMDQGDQPPA